MTESTESEALLAEAARLLERFDDCIHVYPLATENRAWLSRYEAHRAELAALLAKGQP